MGPHIRVHGEFESPKFLVKVFQRLIKAVCNITPESMAAWEVSILIRPPGANCPIRIIVFACVPNEIFATFNIRLVQICVRITFFCARFFLNEYFHAANNRSRSFTLSGNTQTLVNAMVGGGSQGTPNTCTSDWVLIGCAKVADRLPALPTCEDRICGGLFNAEISSVSRTVTSKNKNTQYFLKEYNRRFFSIFSQVVFGLFV